MKRVIVIGCPGSGKSTFSRALAAKTDLPLYHLDMLYWNPDKTVVEKPIFLERLRAVLQKEFWIIDGNYGSTMELRLSLCDTVFFLDYPTEVCLEGIAQRKGKMRSDMPWIETEDDNDFLSFIKRFRDESRPQISEVLRKYADKHIYIFHTREDADAFLQNV